MPARSIKWGEKLPSATITKFRATKQAPSIISVISKEGILGAAIHYADGLGYFHCFEGVCCAQEGPAKVRYILPVVVYRVGNYQNYSVDMSPGVEVQYLMLSEKDYIALQQSDSMIPLDECDFLVTCEDETFQTLRFQIVYDPATRGPRQASWKTDDTVRRSVMSYYGGKYVSLISLSLGRDFKSPNEYMEAKGKAAQNSNNAGGASQMAYNAAPQMPQLPPTMPGYPQPALPPMQEGVQPAPQPVYEQVPTQGMVMPVQPMPPTTQPMAQNPAYPTQAAPVYPAPVEGVVSDVSDEDITNLMSRD